MTRLRVPDTVAPALRAWWRAAGCYQQPDVFTLFARHVREHPRRAAVIDDDGVTTYSELHHLTLRLAGGLRRAGLRAGEVLMCQLPSGRYAAAVELAAAALGSVVLPVPAGRDRHDTAHILRASRAAVAVCTPQAAGTLRELRATGCGLRTVVVSGAAEGAPAPGDCVDLGALVATGPRLSRTVRPAPHAPARIVVTSGSEGLPKLVAYSHEALTGGRRGPLGALVRDGEPPVSFFLVPTASSFGILAVPVTLARHGGTLLVTARFQAERAAAALVAHRPTHVLGVPTMFQMLLDTVALRDADLSFVRVCVSGGARLDATTRERAGRRFGAAVINCYGSADGVSCMTVPGDPETAEPSCVGRPDPDAIAIRLVGEDGQDVGPGRQGEVWGLGPLSPLGYVGDPERNLRNRVEGGWVRTGDLGWCDAEGRLHIAGRMDDLIIRGGQNISPVETELLLSGHPAVRQVCCVAVPDALMGERVCACVVPADPARPPGLAELTSWLHDRHGLDKRKLPELVEFFATLPHGAAGKPDRRALRGQVAAVRGAGGPGAAGAPGGAAVTAPAAPAAPSASSEPSTRSVP